GRWEPAARSSTDPHVVFREDGTWSGSDGCNGGGGAWALDDGGRLVLVGPDGTEIARLVRG
ncbi:MAG: hypothetical protein ACTMIB_11995, partial [Cellulosimicrobium funkei]